MFDIPSNAISHLIKLQNLFGEERETSGFGREAQSANWLGVEGRSGGVRLRGPWTDPGRGPPGWTDGVGR